MQTILVALLICGLVILILVVFLVSQIRMNSLTTEPQSKHFTLLSWNIQGGSRAQDIAARIINVGSELVCLQEDHSSLDWVVLTADRYHIVSRRNAEPLSGGFLCNTILCRTDRLGAVTNSTGFDISCGCSVERSCAYIKFRGLGIANVHLCGGRFDDQKFERHLWCKAHEISKVFDVLFEGDDEVDIITGDFNGEADREIARRNLQTHPVFVSAESVGKGEMFLDWQCCAHDELKKRGFRPLYDEQMVYSKAPQGTSDYGGIPDWTYASCRVTRSAFEILSSNRLSDHSAVLLNCSFVTGN